MANGIKMTIEGRVARIVLSRPERRNAIDTAMLTAFEEVLERLGRERGVDVAVLSGKGPAFCAGTNFKDIDEQSVADTWHWQRRTGELVERWARQEATTVTAFNGPAVGSGAILGLASDLRIATAGTFISFPEVDYGIPLTWSGIPILTALLGGDRARRALLLRERIDADEMARRDLVIDVVPPGELGAATDRLVASLLETAPLARLMAKRAVAAAVAAPGFATNVYEPFLAALGIATRQTNAKSRTAARAKSRPKRES